MSKRVVNINDEGFEDTVFMLETLVNMPDLAKDAVYQGAGIVADEMRKQIKSLKTTTVFTKETRKEKRYCYERDKEVLLEHMGISKIHSKEDVNAKVGFDGYYWLENGERKPIPLLANSINTGTSFMKKQPFINNTVNKCRDRVVKKIMGWTEDKINEVQKK